MGPTGMEGQQAGPPPQCTGHISTWATWAGHQLLGLPSGGQLNLSPHLSRSWPWHSSRSGLDLCPVSHLASLDASTQLRSELSGGGTEEQRPLHHPHDHLYILPSHPRVCAELTVWVLKPPRTELRQGGSQQKEQGQKANLEEGW